MSDFYSYFYENGSALKNKLGIRSEVMLDSAVCNYAYGRMSQLLSESVPEKFDADYLKYVHGVLFGDVFEWAGEYRTCDMVRNQAYCPASLISSEVDRFCSEFQGKFLSQSFSDNRDLVRELTLFWADLNRVHPFRDGNGRSQYVFFNKACETKGYHLEASVSDIKDLRIARDLAFMGQGSMLYRLLSRSLVECPVRQVISSRQQLMDELSRDVADLKHDGSSCRDISLDL